MPELPLIAATSWLLMTLAGLGLPFAMALTGRRPQPHTGYAAVVALALMSGLLIDHGLGLATRGLAAQNAAAWAGLLFGAGGLALLWRTWRSQPASASHGREYWGAILAAALIVILTLAIYAAPLMQWDARSIWFFHGKVIFFDGGLKPSPFWSNHAYDWSHKDYPDLIPMLSARAAAFAGVWNEYAPKGALVPMAAASILALLALARGPAFVFLILTSIATLGPSLWDGYMDGWLALCGTIAALGIAVWAETGERAALALAAAALGVALCLKNEGQLLALVILPALVAAVAKRHNLRLMDLAMLAAAAPFVLWLGVKANLGVHGYLESAGVAHRALAVATDLPELTYRLSFLAENAAQNTHLFAALAAYLAVGLCVGFPRSSLLFGLSAALYAGGLIVVYLGTPLEFAWQVRTSLDRAVMTPTLLFLGGLSTMIPDIISALRQTASPQVS